MKSGKAREQKTHPRILIYYFLINAFEAVFMVLYALSFHATSNDIIILGHPLQGLALGIVFSFITFICIVSVYIYWRNAVALTGYHERILSARFRLWFIFLILNILFFVGLLIFITSLSPDRALIEFYDKFYLTTIAIFIITAKRYLLPVVFWITLVASQTIIGFVFIFREYIKQAIRVEITKSRSGVFIFFVIMASLSILAIGFCRALPFLTGPDKTLGLRLSKNMIMIILQRYSWVVAIYLNLAVAWLWSKRVKYQTNKEISSSTSLWYFLPFIVALLGSYYFLTVTVKDEWGYNHFPSNWDIYYLKQDSFSYISKFKDQTLSLPPGYPLFIELVTSGTNFSHTANYDRMFQPVEAATNDPLLLVVRTQKIVLLLASTFTCIALMGLINSPLPVLLFLGLNEYGFFSREINNILSEPLAQAWLLLILAAFFAFFWKRWRVLLPLAGILCACLYLTRPAGIFCGVLLAAMFLYGLFINWRSYWLFCITSIFLGAALVVLPVIYTYLTTGYLTPTALYGEVKIAFALQVGQSQDINDMPDENTRLFLIKALALKQERDTFIKSNVSKENEQYFPVPKSFYHFVRDNLDIASKAFAETQPNGTYLDWKRLITNVSRLILAKHRFEYYSLSLNTFWYATTWGSLNSISSNPFSFWIIVFICITVALILRGWTGFCSIYLIITHLFHLMTISFFATPENRYIRATEFLVLIAIFILFSGIIQRMFDSWFKVDSFE